MNLMKTCWIVKIAWHTSWTWQVFDVEDWE